MLTKIKNNSKLTLLQEEALQCQNCVLCHTRKQVVFGQGDYHSKIMLVGEAPGEMEDIKGKPFVGRSGALLDQWLKKYMGIERELVYITNLVQCRPPGNRNPTPKEIESCQHFLTSKIQMIEPMVIITLGKHAAEALLGRPVYITHERGQWKKYKNIDLLPTLHPAYVLRNPSAEEQVADDLSKVVLKVLNKLL